MVLVTLPPSTVCLSVFHSSDLAVVAEWYLGQTESVEVQEVPLLTVLMEIQVQQILVVEVEAIRATTTRLVGLVVLGNVLSPT